MIRSPALAVVRALAALGTLLALAAHAAAPAVQDGVPPTVTIPAASHPVPAEPAAGVAVPGATPASRAPAAAASPPASPAAGAPTVPPASTEPDALYAARTRQDRIGRVLAAVTINGQGPFRLVVDTGATRSALAPGVLAQLGLRADTANPVRLRGVTGTRIVPTVLVERLQAGEFLVANARLPIVEPGVLADADGILGLAGLTQERLEVDFAADRTRLVRSTGSRSRQTPTGSRIRGGVSQSVRTVGDANVPGLLRIPLTLSRGGLLVAQARVGRVAATAVIDTGAQRTLGNTALRDALARSAKDPKEPNTYVVGATPDVAPGLYLVAPPIKLGDVMISRVALTYGDFHVFQSWQMDDAPALLLGMDVLGRVDELVIDFRTRELLLRQ
jgi:predicted aspartyl protease